MTIYVDDMRCPAKVGQTFGRWSHLLSDLPGEEGTAELITFAVQGLGLDPSWIQHRGSHREHFDIVDSKRDRAIELGAVPIKYGRETAAITSAKRAAKITERP